VNTQPIAKLKADDVDETVNGQVSYSLQLEEEDEGLFNMTLVNDNWVLIQQLKPLDYEAKSNRTIHVIAQDNPLDKNLVSLKDL